MGVVVPLKTALGVTQQFAAGDVVAPAHLGTGAPTANTALAGNNAWATIPTILGYTPVNKAGDTVSGPLTFSSVAAIQRSVDNSYVTVKGGADWGGTLWLYGKSSVSIAGGFDLRAGTSVGSQAGLIGEANGALSWATVGIATAAGLIASALATGTVPTARLGSGTANSSAYLRGDSTWQTLNSTAVGLGNVTNNAQWHAGNDGSGSGLDADLLDGYHATGLGAIRLQFTSNQSSGMATASSSLGGLEAYNNGAGGAAMMCFHRAGAYAAYFGIDTDNQWKVGGWSMGAAAYKVWHAGNDGAGSGLDADLLDGQHGSYYAPVANPTFTGTVTVGNTTSSNIVMVDTDEGNRTIHCNSNRIGFLTGVGGWGAWSDDDGNWGVLGNVLAGGYLSGTYVSALSAGSSFYQITISKPNNEAHIYFRGDNTKYLYSNPAGFQFSHHTYAPTLGSTVATGTAPLSITSTTVCGNLNADMVDGYHAAVAATVNTLVARDGSGNINAAAWVAMSSGVLNAQSVATDSTFGLYFGSDANGQYAVRREAGAWANPYPDLLIAFHTGIKIGAYFGYGGTRFYNNSDFATQIFSVGDGDNHVRIYNNLYTDNITGRTGADLTIAPNAGNPRLFLTASAPELVFYNSAGTANQRKGRIIMGDGYLYIDIVNDNFSARYTTWSLIIGYNVMYSNTDNACSLGSGSYRWTAVYAVNGTIQTSDAKMKKDIVDTPLGLDFILDVKPKAYRWRDGKDGGRLHHGVVAQDIKEITKKHGEFGGLYDEDGLNYSEFIAPLVRSIHQLNAKIAVLEARA